MAIQHGLHFIHEGESARRTVPWNDRSGFLAEAMTVLAGGVQFCRSWQPMQLSGFGMAVNQLRISARARPSPSST